MASAMNRSESILLNIETLDASHRNQFWCACALWTLYGLLIAGCVLFDQERTTTRAYRQGAEAWVHGEPLYAKSSSSGHGFIYLPQSALVYLPWTILPYHVGEIVWRWGNLLILGLGVWRVCCLLFPQQSGSAFLWNTFVTLILGWQAARSGQATVAMTGLMLLATVEIAQGHMNRAAFCLCFGIAVKPLIVVMMLLVGALLPKLRRPLLVGLVLFVLAPFLTQSPDYVWTQYTACRSMLDTAYKVGLDPNWPQLFSLLEFLGVEFHPSTELAIRMIAACATVCLCWQATRQGNRLRSLELIFILSAVYILLFNPRTEANTYGLVAPAIGFTWFSAARQQRHITSIVCLIICVLFVGNYELGKFLQPGVTPVVLSPLGCVLYLIVVVSPYATELGVVQRFWDLRPKLFPYSW
jgi:alpha-1,2-mannosyltransferase